ncbi:MAG: hypothetical protein JSU06_02275 [Actinobacteria bacterium]|nr:hypothetical protein [Actinomycetota bacterium]
MKVDHYVGLTLALEVALAFAGGLAGGYAWTPSVAGAVAGFVLGYVVAYIVVEILDWLFVIYSDRERLDREMAEGRRERDRGRRKKR